MPKTPIDLPRLFPSQNAADRVKVQQTAFSYDVLGRYICNDWDEVRAQLDDGGNAFDVVVIGAGMFGGYLADKLFRSSRLRVLVLDAGGYLLPSHVQDLPCRLGGQIFAPGATRTREDGSGAQNLVWGLPWISNEPFPGLAYCLGGRSLFWGGWSPRLTDADLSRWPGVVASYLTAPGPSPASPYDETEREIGTATTADFMEKTPFHDVLLAKLSAAQSGQPALTGVGEAPLAVQGASPDSGLFPIEKFSAMPFLMNAVRDDVATNSGHGDLSRRLFVVPQTHVLSLDTADGAVTGLQVVTNGRRTSLMIPPTCAVVLANGTIEATRLALTSLGVGDETFGSPRLGNLMAHLRSNITVRISRQALGLSPTPDPNRLETTAFIVRGQASTGRQFHFQVTAASVGGANSEQNMWQAVPDVDTLDQMLKNQEQKWVTLVFRGIAEMEDLHATPPDPARSWITLSGETDEYGMPRAYVKLVKSDVDAQTWTEMDLAAFSLAKQLAGGSTEIQYLDVRTNQWIDTPPSPTPSPATGRAWWQDSLGSTHHEAGTLFMGDPGASVTDLDGRFHGTKNAYVVGPAAFPTLGSANPSLTALTLARRTADAIANP